MLDSDTSQGTAGHPKDNTPKTIVFLPGKWFTEQGTSGDAKYVLIKVIYSLSFEAMWDLGL